MLGEVLALSHTTYSHCLAWTIVAVLSTIYTVAQPKKRAGTLEKHSEASEVWTNEISFGIAAYTICEGITDVKWLTVSP